MTQTVAPRTDIHRPSAAEFDPEAYECVGVYDLRPEWPGEAQARIEDVNRWLTEGYRFTSVHGGGQCGHCGAHLRYVALMLHPSTKGMIYVGETCLGNRFESTTREQFQALRKAASLNRERAARRDRIAALVDQFPLLAELTYPDAAWGYGDFVGSIADKFLRYGELSERQLETVQAAILRGIERTAKREAQAREEAELFVPAPLGVQQITGKIVHIKIQDGDYGPTTKMLVLAELPDGKRFKVWSTMPASLDDAQQGDRVRFTATLELSKYNPDPLFAIAKRPRKASQVQALPRPAFA